MTAGRSDMGGGPKGRVLAIAGSDSGGGAGIQADIKTVTALGGYAMTAVTALTAQNTEGVFGIHSIPPDFIVRQIELVLADIGADAVKTGMLHTAQVIEAVVATLERLAPDVPLIVDPVMVAKGGHLLLEREAVASLRSRLVPKAAVLTPNLPEAEALSERPIRSLADMASAGRALVAAGARAVLVKGGHLPGKRVADLLVTGEGVRRFEHERIETTNTHGTGCTLASAIATGLAQGLGLEAAVVRARAYVLEAIRSAPGFGHGAGPLNHGVTVNRFGAGA